MLLRPPWRRLRSGLRQSGAEHDAPRSRLYWRQWQSSTARGGLVIQFTVAPHASWGTYDQDGQQINSDNLTNQWHYRRVDLTPFAGKTINWMWITADSQTLPGYYDMTFQDITLVSADGAVRRVFSRDKTIALTPFASSGVTGQAYSISHAAGVGWYPPVTTTYYHGDHLGSSRQMTNADGYPVWEATYLPYGQERAVAGGSSASVNHYKFTGKERDPESGLDYFGARYYASTHGRFLSADEFTGGPVDAFSSNDPLPPGPLPYAEIANPQSLNKYAYTLNNPLNYVDPDGHDDAVATVETVKSGTKIITRLIVTESPKAAGSGAAGGAAAGGAVLTGLSLGLVGAAALAAYSSFDLTRAQIEQEALFAEVGEQNRQKLIQQQQQQEKQEGPAPEPSSQGGARRRTPHGQDRADQARAGDTTRQVGDPNRVIGEGRRFRDTETGNTVHVRGNRVVVTNSKGEIVSQFKNTRRNTQQRIKDGKWEPITD